MKLASNNLGISRTKVPLPLKPTDDDKGTEQTLPHSQSQQPPDQPASSDSKASKKKDKKPPKSKKFAFEIHRFLYKVFTITHAEAERPGVQQYLFSAGEHQFPFEIQIPLDVACDLVSNPTSLSFDRMDIGHKVKPSAGGVTHSLGGLPPSLSDMEKTASIKYFLKASLSRPSAFKKKLRVYQPLTISPSTQDLGASVTDVYVRKNHQLLVDKDWPPPWTSDRGNLKKKKKKFLFFRTKQKMVTKPLNLTFEMRYASNATFSVGSAPPIKLLAVVRTHSSESTDFNCKVMINSVSIRLQATSDLRAQNKEHSTSHWVPMLDSKEIGHILDWSKGTLSRQGPDNIWTNEIPLSLFGEAVIPADLAPSFSMCNIRRGYTMEVSVGFLGAPDGKAEPITLMTPVKIVPAARRATSQHSEQGQMPQAGPAPNFARNEPLRSGEPQFNADPPKPLKPRSMSYPLLNETPYNAPPPLPNRANSNLPLGPIPVPSHQEARHNMPRIMTGARRHPQDPYTRSSSAVPPAGSLPLDWDDGDEDEGPIRMPEIPRTVSLAIESKGAAAPATRPERVRMPTEPFSNGIVGAEYANGPRMSSPSTNGSTEKRPQNGVLSTPQDPFRADSNSINNNNNNSFASPSEPVRENGGVRRRPVTRSPPSPEPNGGDFATEYDAYSERDDDAPPPSYEAVNGSRR